MSKKYHWATWGDLNAFFGLMLDNVTNLVILTGILVGVFNYPFEIIYKKMIPSTALGVLIGDLIYTYMAFNLAKQKGKENVTAMPLGLDTPSTIGMAFAVLGPAYLATKDPILTWKIGMATLIFMGIIKVIMSFAGNTIQKIVPQAGLLGSLAGIGLALLAFLPLIEIFKMPVAGLAALGIILYSLIARLKLPGNIPGAFASVIIGAIIYFILGKLNLLGGHFKIPHFQFYFSLPYPTLGFLEAIKPALKYLPLAIPFGLLTIVGGINVTESARAAGDDYNTRDILLTEALATLIAGICGGVAQSTPYIGHPAYKHMGARAAYTLATGLFIGIGGIFGYISSIITILPVAVVAPILIFVGLEIITQAYQVCPKKHFPAVSFSYLPILANLVLIQLNSLLGDLKIGLDKLSPGMLETYQTINALGHGFILTSMLWGAVLALIINKEFIKSAFYLITCAVFTLFGIIHSIKPNGDVYFPWHLNSDLHYNFALAYIVFALFLIIMSFTKKEILPEE
ncbi:MAG: hypothetical protein HYU63_09215 [Armatimonadetes bacterium]|nr:hypothetical protein [Armatimonadota bacterium]